MESGRAAQFGLHGFLSRPNSQASLHLCYSKHPAAPVFPNSSRNAGSKGGSSLPAGPAPSSGSAAVSCRQGEPKASNQASVGKISPPEQPGAHTPLQLCLGEATRTGSRPTRTTATIKALPLSIIINVAQRDTELKAGTPADGQRRSLARSSKRVMISRVKEEKRVTGSKANPWNWISSGGGPRETGTHAGMSAEARGPDQAGDWGGTRAAVGAHGREACTCVAEHGHQPEAQLTTSRPAPREPSSAHVSADKQCSAKICKCVWSSRIGVRTTCSGTLAKLWDAIIVLFRYFCG